VSTIFGVAPVSKRSSILSKEFYARETVTVANDMLGKLLVRVRRKARLVGRIVEVEAYRGSDDPASHAFRGRTPRNLPMFGEPGHAYIYFTYGNHYCLNVSTHVSGMPGAVLIRAVEPVEGVSIMKKLRPNVPALALTNGPGKLTKALGIDKSLNEVDMTRLGPLFIADSGIGKFRIARSARIGVSVGRGHLWRFYISGNKYVSRGQAAPKAIVTMQET